jgi:hypothetical protein
MPCSLGGRVVGLAAIAQRRHRRQVDDPPPIALDHLALRRPRAQKGALQMHRDDRVPIVVGHLVDQIVAGDAGVVDEDVERAEAQRDLLDQALDFVGDGDIGLEAERLDPIARGDLCRHRLGGVKIEIAQRHRSAVLGQPFGGRRADPARPAGDQRDASFRSSRHPLPLPSAAFAQIEPPARPLGRS